MIKLCHRIFADFNILSAINDCKIKWACKGCRNYATLLKPYTVESDYNTYMYNFMTCSISAQIKNDLVSYSSSILH